MDSFIRPRASPPSDLRQRAQVSIGYMPSLCERTFKDLFDGWSSFSRIPPAQQKQKKSQPFLSFLFSSFSLKTLCELGENAIQFSRRMLTLHRSTEPVNLRATILCSDISNADCDFSLDRLALIVTVCVQERPAV